MSWVYLDDQFPEHPKVVRAGGRPAWMFVCGLAYCKRQGTEGVIPRAQIARLTDLPQPQRLARKLIEVGLWIDDGENVVVHDWSEWNRSSQSRSDAARKAARARWGNRGDNDANGNADASESHDERTATGNASTCPNPLPHPCIETSTAYSRESAPPDGGGGRAKDPLTEAARIVAEAEAKRRGPEIANPPGYVAARTRPLRERHEPTWRRILEREPDSAPAQLAQAVLDPPSGSDRAVAAAWQRAERFNGACAACGGTGMTLDDDGLAVACEAC